MARPKVTAASGTTLVVVNPGVRHQTFEGWGTSLCWWANHVGGWSTANRNALVDKMTDATNGLGYNVFRYNIGGGDDPTHTHMGQYKNMPGFEPSSGTWDWNADANQRAILQRIVADNANAILEAFSNSPPYWMTKSGCASGNTDGSNNLNDNSYNAFADYLTEVVKHYKDTFGITFRTVEPLNEPNATWWKSLGGQEGCHFSPANQQTIIKAVATSLTTKGLTGTTVSASDENSIDDGYNNIKAFDATTIADMSQMNVHTYSGSSRTQLRALATSKGKRLWASESGPLNTTLADDTDAAVFMAGRIISDLRDLQPQAWVDWQVGDPSTNWASFTLNDAQQTFGYSQALLHARRIQPQHPPRGDVRRRQRHRHGRRRERRRQDAGDRRAQRQHDRERRLHLRSDGAGVGRHDGGRHAHLAHGEPGVAHRAADPGVELRRDRGALFDHDVRRADAVSRREFSVVDRLLQRFLRA